jgi:hypothetical protein
MLGFDLFYRGINCTDFKPENPLRHPSGAENKNIPPTITHNIACGAALWSARRYARTGKRRVLKPNKARESVFSQPHAPTTGRHRPCSRAYQEQEEEETWQDLPVRR